MTSSRRHRSYAGWVLAFIAMLGLAGCDYLDPTAVDNPATTDDDLAQSEAPTAALLPGIRAQFARAINPVDPEVVSDNYQIRGTGIDKAFDDPRRITADVTSRLGRSYSWLQELRALADFVLDDIVPDDETATDEQIGEAHAVIPDQHRLVIQHFQLRIDKRSFPVHIHTNHTLHHTNLRSRDRTPPTVSFPKYPHRI